MSFCFFKTVNTEYGSQTSKAGFEAIDLFKEWSEVDNTV